jgi:hypothetical protein
MSADADRAAFEALAAEGAEDDAARVLGGRLKTAPQPADLKALAALWIHAAAAAPERAPGLYDAAAEGWLGEPAGGPEIRTAGGPPEIIPAAFWALLWDSRAMRGQSVAARTAALTEQLSPNLPERVDRAAMAYPGARAAAAQGAPRPYSRSALARYAPDSLAGALHALVETSDTAREPLPVGDVEARVRRDHHLWRLVAGYEATALHELAMAGFQLAQCGHHPSAMFLGTSLARVALERPEGGPLLLATIFAAWVHGRRSPPLPPVRWESVWSKPVAEVRAALGVTPFASPFPADLFEQQRA